VTSTAAAGLLRGAPRELLGSLPELALDSHKGDAGRLFTLCGSRTMPGAAILVARAAGRSGCGLVRVACLDPELLLVVPAAVPEAVLVDLMSDARALVDAGDDARVVGPGLGSTARTLDIVTLLIDAGDDAPLVLDADALNVLAEKPERLAGRTAPTVITPHPGEAARLLGRSIPRDEPGRVESARELAARSRAVTVLKGHGTVVAEPEARVWINSTGNPGMATAGSGDVLAGILGAYLAQAARARSLGAFEAACHAVWVHGRAGDLAFERVGARGLIASDLIAALPAAQGAGQGDEP